MKRIAAILLLMPILLLNGCKPVDPLANVPNPIATITLSDGRVMRFELYVRDAPNTVANFVSLATSGFYSGMKFFRIVPGVLIQSGDRLASGTGDAGYVIQGEFAENGIANPISHRRGAISMARQADYDTASSQFFIMQGSYPEYDGQYAAFGMALDSETLDVIDAIATTAVDANYSPIGRVPTIASVTCETGGFSYEPATMKKSE